MTNDAKNKIIQNARNNFGGMGDYMGEYIKAYEKSIKNKDISESGTNETEIFLDNIVNNLYPSYVEYYRVLIKLLKNSDASHNNEIKQIENDFYSVRDKITEIKKELDSIKLKRIRAQREENTKIMSRKTLSNKKGVSRNREMGSGTNATMNRISQNIKAVTKQNLDKFGKL